MAHQDPLTIAGHHIADLVWNGDSDFPWAHGTLVPGPAFAVLEPFLVLRADGGRHLDDAALGAVHPSSTWLLPSADPTYLHALVLWPAARAAWRIGLAPLDD